MAEQDDTIEVWRSLPVALDALTEKYAAQAAAAQAALAGFYTAEPVWVVAPMAEGPARLLGGTDLDRELVKRAVAPVLPVDSRRMPDAVEPYHVKLANSPGLVRSTMETLNYLPGKYFGRYPNNAGVVTGALTGGLVGAGLGYGAGWLGETLMPDNWERKKLRRTLSMLGAAGGVAFPAIYAASNWAAGKPPLDFSTLNHPAGAQPNYDLPKTGADINPRHLHAIEVHCALRKEAQDAFLKNADWAMRTTGNHWQERESGPLDVNVDALGRTLWHSGDPALAGMTMGAMHAASRMPGGSGRPGFVTTTQVGMLAAHMGAGYLSGKLVGALLGGLTGLPAESQETLARGGMYTGFVRSVVPHLFGSE